MSNDLVRRRHLLGKDEKWIQDILGEYSGLGLSRASTCLQSKIERRLAAENILTDDHYHPSEVKAFRKLYDKALTELENSVPVCPEGVVSWSSGTGIFLQAKGLSGCTGAFLEILKDGTIKKVVAWKDAECSPEMLEYAAALSRHLTSKHKSEDRQSKLDALAKAKEEHDISRAEWEAADKKWRATARALDSAKAEAGL